MVIQTINGIFSKIENQAEKKRLFTIDLEEEIEFESGQFINLIFEYEGEKYMKPYSLASNKNNKFQIELSINLVEHGQATPKLFQKIEGDECQIKGPFGLFKFNPTSEKQKVLLIGTGTGIAPLRSILFELLTERREREIILLYGSRYEHEILFEKELDKLTNENGHLKFTKVISSPSEKWEGRTGYVQDNLDVVDALNSDIYICGRPEMVQAVKEKLILNGADEADIHNEKYV